MQAAECGQQVIRVKKNTTVVGRASQLYRYFSCLWHPTCGLENKLKRMRAQKNLPADHDRVALARGMVASAGDLMVKVNMNESGSTEQGESHGAIFAAGC